MTQSSPQRATALALVKPDPAGQAHATCPLCQTTHVSLSSDAPAADGGWRCVRCGEWWDARRLGTVAAYVDWTLERASRCEWPPQRWRR